MASHQKSFFDQKPKTDRQWRKPRGPFNSVREPNQCVQPTMPTAPIAASSQSRTRLKAFQFVPNPDPNVDTGQGQDYGETEKENISFPADVAARKSSQVKASQLHSSQQSAREDQEDCPQTPAGRLPLAELISNGEDALNQAPSLTPVERVLWNNSPKSSDFPDSATPIRRRRGRKRSHSSSPATSSSQNEASAHFAAKSATPSFDLQTLQKSLKTPQADPASDLWNRYSLNALHKSTSTEQKTPVINLFLNSSSPESPVNRVVGNDSVGLRRSFSCGDEWPTSAAKRRKLRHGISLDISKNKDVISFSGEEHGHGLTKISRVSALVEKIHQELAGPSEKSITTGPSSSSPLLDRRGTDSIRSSHKQDDERIHGAHSTLRNDGEGPKIQETIQLQPKGNSVLNSKAPSQEESCSSSFEGDFDFDMLEAVESMQNITRDSITTVTSANKSLTAQDGSHPDRVLGSFEQCNSTHASAECGATSCISGKKLRAGSEGAAHREYSPLPQTTSKHFEDEFGDYDDEFFAADLEDVVAIYDQRPQRDLPRSSGLPMIEEKAQGVEAKDASVRNLSARPGAESEKERDVVELSSDNEFGDDLDFEQIAVECASANPSVQAASPSQSHGYKRPPTIQRYLVKDIADGQDKTEKGFARPEKVLLVQDENTKLRKAVILRQSWLDSPCTKGSYIHVIGKFDHAGQCTIDDAHNMLVLHPDHLISATVVADSFGCARRAVLQDRVKATSEANEAQIYGHILHEIFQEAMKANRWDADWMSSTIKKIAVHYLEALFEINVEPARAIEHLMSKVPELQQWAELFIAAKPKPDAMVKDRNGTQALMSINKLLDVEEHVWSPMYGLKGNIDATVQVVMRDGTNERTLTVPFEVKTGKNNSNASHQAQTALYTLLLSDRYDVEVTYGILYYMETSEISRIPALRHELRHMIMQRNELACYIRNRLELPPMLKSPHLCNRCYAKNSCFVYHKLVEGGDGETSGLKEKFDDAVKHLNYSHQEFFKKWDDLLTKEEKDVLKFRRELWTLQSSEREKLGRCFGNVVIEPGSALELPDAPKINRYSYILMKHQAKSSFSFTESQITVGEPIVISDEKGHFALANGYVTHVRKKRITVLVDRRLHNARVKGHNFDGQKNQTFAGIMEVIDDGARPSTTIPKEPQEEILYRLDKDEFSNGMATVRNNLIRIMEKNLFGAQALRRLVIELEPPTFLPKTPTCSMANSESQANLNIDQKNAITKVMCAKDYTLVLGMPGTGKTTTIAHIIRALIAQGKSVLLTSYTHTAVDNILLKIRDDKIGILRIGALARIHPEVRDFAELAAIPKPTIEELQKSYNLPVVATTCLGINHPLFNQRIFDYCIVDEASQITLPVCLGPIRMSRTFILVGDHNQLPPLVQNKEAQEGGLDVSLFKLLSDAHPSSVTTLEHQYRMCEDIMMLSNTLIYSGRLKCGTPAVATRHLSIPNLSALARHHHNPTTLLSSSHSHICPGPASTTCWLASLLSPYVRVAFLNTDPLLPTSRETAFGPRITNTTEATITMQIVESLLTVGVPPSDIGVIALYRSQLALLKQHLKSIRGSTSAVEMHTADRFQGRDKDVIILNLVRSNEEGCIGDLLRDWRRVNVCLTRARTKLIIVGSRGTIGKGSDLLARFVALVEKNGWMVGLPVGAAESHLFEGGARSLGSTIGTAAVVAEAKKLGHQRAKVEREDKEIKIMLDEEKENVPVLGSTTQPPKPPKSSKRVPEKVARIDPRALLKSRPVLQDVVNDVLG